MIAIRMISDGNDETLFWSEGAPKVGDYVSLHRLDPTEMSCGIRVVTGKDGKDRCERCKVSIQIDSDTDFDEVGFIDDSGMLMKKVHQSYVTAIRLEVLESQRSWLMVREMEALPCLNTGSETHEPGKSSAHLKGDEL